MLCLWPQTVRDVQKKITRTENKKVPTFREREKNEPKGSYTKRYNQVFVVFFSFACSGKFYFVFSVSSSLFARLTDTRQCAKLETPTTGYLERLSYSRPRTGAIFSLNAIKIIKIHPKHDKQKKATTL